MFLSLFQSPIQEEIYPDEYVQIKFEQIYS
jgi:hypothetical protein